MDVGEELGVSGLGESLSTSDGTVKCVDTRKRGRGHSILLEGPPDAFINLAYKLGFKKDPRWCIRLASGKRLAAKRMHAMAIEHLTAS